MHRSKIGTQKWAITLYLMNTSFKSIPIVKLSRELGISQKAARLLAQKIRQGWDYAKPKLQGEGEADEIYSRNEESNRHASKTLRTGPGTCGKATHMDIKECDGEVRVDHVPHTTANTGCVGVEAIVEDQAIKHSAGNYVEAMEYTNGIVSFVAPMNHGYVGSHREISPEHLHRYTLEFTGTHNAWRLETINQMKRIANGLEGKQIPYADLIAGNGLDAETVQ